MNAVGRLVRHLMDENGLKLRDLAPKVGISHTALGKKITGKIQFSHADRKAIAAAFDMTLEDFDSRWRPARIERSKGGVGIPVINRAPAGQVVDYEEHGTDSGQGMEYLDSGEVLDDLAFAVIAIGDSMEPTIHSGDYVVFQPATGSKRLHEPRIEPGAVVFIRFAAEAPNEYARGCTIARVQAWDAESRVARFTKDNRKYPDIVCPQTVNCIDRIARAVEIRTRRAL